MTPKSVRNDYILKTCVGQSVSELASGIYMINFGNPTSMSLKEFGVLANTRISNAPNEDSFWEGILKRNGLAPVYALDNEKSLYPKDWLYWGMNQLNSDQSIIHGTEYKFKGINTPYLNFGMEFTTFGLHHEDSNLGSINILHGGMPKLWYGIPSSNAPKLEKMVKFATPRHIQCDLLIRHKNILIPPSVLEMNDIGFSKVSCWCDEIIIICIV